MPLSPRRPGSLLAVWQSQLGVQNPETHHQEEDRPNLQHHNNHNNNEPAYLWGTCHPAILHIHSNSVSNRRFRSTVQPSSSSKFHKSNTIDIATAKTTNPPTTLTHRACTSTVPNQSYTTVSHTLARKSPQHRHRHTTTTGHTPTSNPARAPPPPPSTTTKRTVPPPLTPPHLCPRRYVQSCNPSLPPADDRQERVWRPNTQTSCLALPDLSEAALLCSALLGISRASQGYTL